MNSSTDLQLIEAYIARRDWLKEKGEAFKKEIQPYVDQMKTLENEMLRRLNERGSDNSATEAGTAYKTRTMQVQCFDRPAFHKFCLDNYDTYGKDLLTAHIAREGLNTFIEKTKNEQFTNGQLPPGIKVDYEIEVRFRK